MLNIVAAVGRNNAIGKDNSLIWHLPNDLQHFKTLTQGHTIIMGRKTFESLGRVLPNRKHIVLSRNMKFDHQDVVIASSLGEVLSLVKYLDKSYVIGGGEIYKLFLPYCQRLYLTEVDIDAQADTFFPTIDPSKWKIVDKKEGLIDDKNQVPHRFITLERIN